MSAYYLDTRAFIKRYVAEVGSGWVRSVMARRAGNVLYALVIAQPEAISAIQRKVREGHLDQDRARRLSHRVSTHFTHRTGRPQRWR